MTTVEAVSANGTGCPGATPTADLVGDTVEVTIPGFTVKRGTGATPTEFRKNCQFSLRVTDPRRFALAGVDTEGTLDIHSGTTAKLTIKYYFQGAASTSLIHSFTGPETGGWADSSDAAALVYGDGTKLLNVNTELLLTGTGTAVDTFSLAAPVIVRLAWEA